MFDKPMALERPLHAFVPVEDRAYREKDLFGVEIELEGIKIKTQKIGVRNLWSAHNDGSLRAKQPPDEAVEYIFPNPYNMEETKEAIQVLFAHLNSPEVTVYKSYRTSVHVHINCASEPMRVVYNYITLCLILDELLVSQNGEHRIGNNFCLRTKDALGQVQSLMESIKRGDGLMNLHPNERYCSINFASLLKFGTVEFRSLECTTHVGRVMHWIQTLNHLKQVSRRFKDPTEIIMEFSKVGPTAFLFDILGPYAVKYNSVIGVSSMLRTGMRIAQDFAYCSEWISDGIKEADGVAPAKPKKFRLDVPPARPDPGRAGQDLQAAINRINQIGRE